MERRVSAWMVEFDSEAVVDLEAIKGRGDRKAVFEVIRKLKNLGPELAPPHMKSLQGEADLFELRPKRGACEARLIYARTGSRFRILAVAARKKELTRATLMARKRHGVYLGSR